MNYSDSNVVWIWGILIDMERSSKPNIKGRTMVLADFLTRANVLRWLRSTAQVAFGFGIFFSTFRYRFILYELRFPPIYQDYTDGLVFLSDVFLLLALLLWVGSLAVNPKRITFGPLVLSIPLGGLILASIVSALFSINPVISAYHVLRLIALSGLYLYVVNEIRTLRTVIWAIAGSVFIQASVGVAQVLRQHSLGLILMGELELDPAWSGVSIVWAEGIRSLRAYGLSDHPNILGGCLAFALLLLMSWLITRDSPVRMLIAGVFISGVVALFLTFSRAAWLGFIVGLLLMAWLLIRTQRREIILNGAYLMLACLVVLTPFILRNAKMLGVRLNMGDSFQEVGYETRSLVERAALNTAANEIFARNAVTGVGIGTFPLALRESNPDFEFFFQPPHNTLLNAAAETGIFGALFYFLALVGPWIATIWNRRRLRFTTDMIGVLAAMATIIVVGFFDYYTWLLAPGRTWAWLVWGLWASFYHD